MRPRGWRAKTRDGTAHNSPDLSAKNAHDSARAAERVFCLRVKLEQMKTAAQRIQTADTIELVPQILNLKKILVPIDFSPMSKKAFHYALRFAEQFGCEIVLLHVVEPETVIAGTSLGVDVFAQQEDDMTAAKAELAPWQQARAAV